MSGSSIARISYFEWLETKIVAQRAVTEGDDGKKVEILSPKDHIRSALGILEAIRDGDTRPTLLYFHWPHDATPNGKLSDMVCDRALCDEMAARWGMLFRCVQLDMSASDARLVELLEAGVKPSFAVLDADAKVVARIAAPSTGMKLAKALEETVAKLPDVAKRVKDALDAQERTMAEAKALLKADKGTEALAKMDAVRFSSVRVGPLFDNAQQDGFDLETRMAKASGKAGSK